MIFEQTLQAADTIKISHAFLGVHRSVDLVSLIMGDQQSADTCETELIH